MKFVLVILVVLAGMWLWRRNRAEEARDTARRPPHTPPSPPPSLAPSTMVSCTHCGLHLPSTEAVQGARGPYCCPEHLRQHEA